MTTPDYSARNTQLLDLPLDQVAPSAYQPRTTFDEAELQQLADSIAQEGLLQPIVVRHRRDADGLPSASLPGQPAYEIVAGERRWRAHQLLGAPTIPSILRDDLDTRQAAIAAMAENMRRVDLNPIELAHGIARLRDAHGLKQTEIADLLGRSQPAVANSLRLLDLPPDVQDRIRTGELTQSHGTALARFKDRPALASKVAEIVVRDQLPTHRIEKELPSPDELVKAKLAVQLGYDDPFKDTCRECPFGAYQHGSYQSYCLQPEHYRELKKEAKETARQVYEAAVAGGSTTEEGQPLREADLPNGTYVRVYTPPTGCSEACPCRRTALGSYGGNIQLCLDRARHEQLRAAELDAVQQARTAQRLARFDRLQTTLAEDRPLVDGLDLHLVAIVAAAAVSRCNADVIRDALTRRLGRADLTIAQWSHDFHTHDNLAWLFDRGAEVGPAKLLHAMAAVYLENEVNNSAVGRGLDWLFGVQVCTSCSCTTEAPCQEGCHFLADDCCACSKCKSRLVTRADADPRPRSIAVHTDPDGVAAVLTPGVCQVCGCTDEEGCELGCDWVDASQTLCTECLNNEDGGCRLCGCGEERPCDAPEGCLCQQCEDSDCDVCEPASVEGLAV